MLQTIEIYQESGKRSNKSYRAIRGQQQAEGKTAGQALDSLEKMLTTSGESSNSLVILQRFQPDTLFPETAQMRLQALMSRFHDAINQDTELTAEERTELEQLIDAEWIAAIARTTTILTQTNQPPTP
jgi:hypothetical protein